MEPWVKLRADPVTTRWQHREVEPILGVLDLRVVAGVSEDQPLVSKGTEESRRKFKC